MTSARRYLSIALLFFVCALGVGSLVNAADLGHIASLFVGVGFLAVAVPLAGFALLLRRRR
jgi:hypothetical protein